MIEKTDQTEQSEDPRAHRWAVVAIVLMLLVMLAATMGAGWVTKTVVERRAKSFFERQADQIANTFYNNIFTNVLMIEGIRGLWDSYGKFDQQIFATYVKSLTVNLERPSGVSSFFYVPAITQGQVESRVNALRAEKNIPEAYKRFVIHPVDGSQIIYPAFYVEPLVGREGSLGLDFGTFPERLAAIEYARDNNTLATTESVILQTTGKPGFFFLLPVYRPVNKLERVPERREAFAGVVGAAFRSEDAFRQIFGNEDPYPYLDFQVYQGEATTADRLLHDHDPNYETDDPMFQTTRVVRLRGQSWTIVVESKPGAVLGSEEERLPLWVFGGGVIATTIVITYFGIMYWRHLREHSLGR